MRTGLLDYYGERHTFVGTYARNGMKRGWFNEMEFTVLLKNVKLVGSNKVLTDHLWFNYTKQFQKLDGLKTGDEIQFDGRVSSYTKSDINDLGERFYYNDLKISRPTKVKIINE